MSITPTIVIPAGSTLLGNATPSYHANFNALASAITTLSTTVDGNATAAQLTTHKASADHDTHNDARYASISTAAAKPMLIPFSFGDADEMATFGGRLTLSTSGIPVPPGTVKIMIAGASNNKSTSSVSLVLSADSIVSVDLSALGSNEYSCMLVVNGSSTGVVASLTTRPLFGTILFYPA